MEYFKETCWVCGGEVKHSGHMKFCYGLCGQKEMERIEKELKSKSIFRKIFKFLFF